MDHPISLQISTPTFLKLADYLRAYGDERDPSQIATLAIDAWLAVAKGEAAFAPSLRGYQWKDLFLNGTGRSTDFVKNRRTSTSKSTCLQRPSN